MLLPHHAELLGASGVSEEVAAERGYWSATKPAQLTALGFAAYQAELVPALVIPVYGPGGDQPAIHQIRPDKPRRSRRGKPLKYELPDGGLLGLDVPRRVREHLGNPQVPLVITEGARKVDSGLSAGLDCIVGLTGVWGFRGTNINGGKALLADFDSVAWNGRGVAIIFDSDVMTKREVYGALVRLAEVIKRRGGKVGYVYLPPGPDGAKVGLDDYLADSHDLDDLRDLYTATLRDPPGELELICAADVRPRQVRWVYEGRVPLGMLTLLCGLPGQGKTTLGMELCARLTRGELEGALEGTPRRVLVASLEDTLEETLTPRLILAGADLELVTFVRCHADKGGALDLTRHLGEIDRAAETSGAALLFIDPLMATLPSGKVNAYRDQDVRSVLAPLAQLCEERRTSVLAAMHFTKAAMDALLGVGGAVGFTGAARSLLIFGVDPTDEQGYKGPARVLAHRKCNVGRIAPSLSCTVHEDQLAGWEGEAIVASRLEIGGETEVDADELVGTAADAPATKLEVAAAVIRHALRGGDWLEARTILDWLVAAEDISERRTQEAAKRVGVERERREMGGSVWWRLSAAGQRDFDTGNQQISGAVPPLSDAPEWNGAAPPVHATYGPEEEGL